MKREIDAELGGMLGRITETSEQIARCTERLNQAEIKKVREESEINANKNRLWEEYELAYSSAKDVYKRQARYPAGPPPMTIKSYPMETHLFLI